LRAKVRSRQQPGLECGPSATCAFDSSRSLGTFADRQIDKAERLSGSMFGR
jgi:hypothetical protein